MTLPEAIAGVRELAACIDPMRLSAPVIRECLRMVLEAAEAHERASRETPKGGE